MFFLTSLLPLTLLLIHLLCLFGFIFCIHSLRFVDETMRIEKILKSTEKYIIHNSS